MRFFLSVCLFLVWGCAAAFAADATGLLGYWSTPDQEGVIQIYACGDALCGRFVWLKDDSAENPSLDDKNPDPSLQKRPLCGMTFMGGFQPEKGAEAPVYDGGWIYSPRHGSRFSAQLKLLEPDQLELHGFMFIPFLGQSQVWTRVAQPKSCQTALSSLK